VFRPRCSEPIGLTRSEYEAVRAVPVRFAIALNHENPEIDRVLFENQRFATVEKFLGPERRSPAAPTLVAGRKPLCKRDNRGR
jgi:hypothetical protein